MEPVSADHEKPALTKAPSFLPAFGDSPSDSSTEPVAVDGHHGDVDPGDDVDPSWNMSPEPVAVPLHAPRRPSIQQQQTHYPVANSITGSFSNISQRYSIDHSRTLGHGHGMAVCVCTDQLTGEHYAVKTVVKGQRTGKRDLHREVSLLRDLRRLAREEGCWRPGRGGGVIELVDLYEDASNLHFVTELCRGGELTDLIHDRVEESERHRAEGWTSPPCFTEDDASTVLRQVLSAVGFLHSHDIVHRDIKPENILFLYPEKTRGPDGQDIGLTVRLADLGVARYHHASSFEPRMSTVVGTCTFIAPEVLRRRYDRKCDLWSLGVVSYVMMCGYPPFMGDTNEEVCETVLKGRFRFDPKDWGDVSKDSEAFVKGLLKVNVKSRMGLEEAMEHPFIAEHGARPEPESGGGMRRTMSSAGLRKSISKGALGGIRRNISKLSFTSMVSAEDE